MDYLKVYGEFSKTLVTSLPMKDVVFLAEMNKTGLFSGDLKAEVKAMSTAKKAADYFLDNKIEQDLISGDNNSFLQLLSVMEEHSESLNRVATKIRRKLTVKEMLPVESDYKESTSVTG